MELIVGQDLPLKNRFRLPDDKNLPLKKRSREIAKDDEFPAELDEAPSKIVVAVQAPPEIVVAI